MHDKICSIACVPISSVEGPATHVRELHTYLPDHGFDVTLWLVDLGLPAKIRVPSVTRRSIRVPNIRVLRFLLFDLALFARLLILFQRRADRPNLIYLRQSYSTLLPALLAKILHIPLIVEVNGFFDWDLTSRGTNPFIKIYCRLAESISYGIAGRIICVTNGIKENIDRVFHTQGKTIVIRNGVNTDRLAPKPKRDCRERLGLPAARPIVGYVGCFTPWDGVLEMVDCVPDIVKSHSNLYFVWVGNGHTYERTVQRVRELGLTDRFHFPGFVDSSQLNDYISSFDIAVAPYRAHRNRMGLSSLKCLEYFACGVPTLVSNVPEMEYVSASGGGRQYQADDSRSLTHELCAMLDDMDRLREMGERARDWVCRHSSWAETARQTAIVFREILRE